MKELKQYFPSNGTEGWIFTSKFCDRCIKKSYCSILFNSYIGKKSRRWIYDVNGDPTCLSFTEKMPIKKRISKDQLNLF